MDTKEKLQNRESLEVILESRASIERIEYVREILSALSSIICIINETNQVVFTNDVMLHDFGIDLEKHVLGKRPGEFLNCENARNNTGGCGTTEKCEYCGAFHAIDLSWKEKKKITRECKIISEKDCKKFQLDLEITATPMHFDEQYLIISLVDISEKKHKQLLERIFFHDILNIAGSLNGIIKLFPLFSDDERLDSIPIMSSLTDQIIDEIKAQRQMIMAEKGNLSIESKTIEVDSFLKNVLNKIKFHQVSIDKNITIEDPVGIQTIKTDEILLTRILVNMIKNGLEEITTGETLTVSAVRQNGFARFSVHNHSFIPRKTQLQIFKRSFSTKGKDRGLGTYSMKLLGEKFLNGKVDFTSTKEKGTTFFIDLPYNTYMD